MISTREARSFEHFRKALPDVQNFFVDLLDIILSQSLRNSRTLEIQIKMEGE